MITINVPEWKGKIASLDMSRSAYAKELGIARNTLQTYFDHPDKVPYRIIAQSIEVLNMNYEDAARVFFNNQLTQSAS